MQNNYSKAIEINQVAEANKFIRKSKMIEKHLEEKEILHIGKEYKFLPITHQKLQGSKENGMIFLKAKRKKEKTCFFFFFHPGFYTAKIFLKTRVK